MSEMIEMQQFLVADHIARLDEEAAALRAERRRNRLRGRHVADDGRRVRLGRWLVGVGHAIAGDEAESLPHAA